MGKRQIGELQPSEFVIAMMISEIASIPMQDNGIPIINSLGALFMLVAFEIIVSFINMKSRKLREIIQGHPVIVIKDGTVDMKALSMLRMTLNDLLGALRQKDVFDISDVSYAIFETNGQISVLLKPGFRASTASDLNLSPPDNGMPFAVICDGEIIDRALEESGRTREFVENAARSQNIPVGNIVLMTVDSGGNISVIRKETDG